QPLINNNSKYLLVMLSILLTTACTKNVFDKKDLSGVDPGIWNLESASNLYINKTYDLVMPNWPVPGGMHNTSDESNNANTTLLYGQLTDNSVVDIASNNTSSSNNQYFTIRRINLAIQGLTAGTLPPEIKSKLLGQMYFFRAFIYFNLVKLYGGVPLVLVSQDIANDDLDVPRSKTSECIKQIVSDLDSCYGLPKSWNLSSDGGRITKAAALALKGKALMYWASPQFNPANDGTRWEAAYQACRAAYDSCLNMGYDLLPNFANIFLDESASNKERIMWRTLDNVTLNPARGTNTENITRPYSETTGGAGSNQPTWNLVQAFPMVDGLPITDPASNYDPVLFWKNRDPRFEATIAYNGQIWSLSGKNGRRQWNYLSVLEDKPNESKTGFYCRKICNPNITATGALYNSNSAGGSGMDWIEMRFAEVLLNLAECANWSGRATECNDLLVKLRKRAGIIQGTHNYGLDAATDQQQMGDLIITEREVEFAMEGKRYDDLRRTRKFGALTGTVRQGYRWTVKDPYVLGTIPATPVPGKIYLEVINALGFKPRDTANLNNVSVYTAMFTTSTYPLDTSTPITFPDNYYFYPLPTGFRTSSVVIEQTIGWPGGTFDPLQ
ncbi:MAG: RagB/SusD family nutrient uptake outer membrane protein, partial [Chitinophagaceae bacterium]